MNPRNLSGKLRYYRVSKKDLSRDKVKLEFEIRRDAARDYVHTISLPKWLTSHTVHRNARIINQRKNSDTRRYNDYQDKICALQAKNTLRARGMKDKTVMQKTLLCTLDINFHRS